MRPIPISARPRNGKNGGGRSPANVRAGASGTGSTVRFTVGGEREIQVPQRGEMTKFQVVDCALTAIRDKSRLSKVFARVTFMVFIRYGVS